MAELAPMQDVLAARLDAQGPAWRVDLARYMADPTADEALLNWAAGRLSVAPEVSRPAFAEVVAEVAGGALLRGKPPLLFAARLARTAHAKDRRPEQVFFVLALGFHAHLSLVAGRLAGGDA